MKCPNCEFDNTEDSTFCRKCGTRLPFSAVIQFDKTMTLDTVQKIISKGSLFAGKYKILGVLGHGGMGIVYQAEDMKLKRTVALKFLPAEFSRYPEAKERFIREAQAAAVLDHPHICTVHEVEEAEGVTYIAMAYVAGETLREKIAKKPLDIDLALDIALQVAEGLEAAHKRGIIHRDIKSGNIMVREDGQARIMDFGLAKVAGQSVLTRDSKTMGTVAYMSPEQARGEETDHRTDLWSLGVVLYEMLTGELPFRGERETSIMYSIVHEEPRPLQKLKPGIPIEIIRIVEKALRKDRNSRYTSAAEMAHDLRKYQEAVRAEAAGVFNLRSLLRRLRKPQVAIPAALVLIAITCLAFWFFNRQAKIRWARETVLPEILRFFEEDDYSAAFDRAQEIRHYIPKDPQLIEILPEIERTISVVTSPPNADVFMRDYRDLGKEWEFLGKTPIQNKKISREFKRWKIVKDGYETLERSDIIEGPPLKPITKKVDSLELNIKLDPKGNLPPEMVRIPGGETEVGRLEDFLLDRFEVTNKEFKEFMDKGGYRRREFWKYQFIKDGRVLSWEEAMAEFIDSTGRPGPSTWAFGDYPEGQDDYPVAGVSWYEAAAYAEFAGKRLPTFYHWRAAAGVLNVPFIVPLSNFEEKTIAPVGTYQGMSPYGTYDMAGNVKEWVWNEGEKGRYNLGGGWNEPQYMFTDPEFLPPMMRAGNLGFRCMKLLSGEVLQAAFNPLAKVQQRDFANEKPCSEDVFEVLKSHYYYDKRDLNPVVESRDETPRYWVVEKVTYDAGYENERMISYIFLPKTSSPPFQTILYFPGGAASALKSIKDYSVKRYDVFIKEGRAFVFPIYSGTFERKGSVVTTKRTPTSRRDAYVKYFKEFARTMDYLETRSEFDKNKFIYFGLSWGASEPGFIINALEKRLKAAVFLCGGFHDIPDILPESNPVNFAPRIKLPLMMMNGIYDNIFSFEKNAKVAFRLLGTSEKDKFLKSYASSHYLLTTNVWIKDTLDFLDRYLGPQK